MKALFQWLFDRLADLVIWIFTKVSALGLTIITGVKGALGMIVPQANLALLDQYHAGINHFFPLNETVGLATSLFGVWVICVLYRLIKSWVPTVSGT
ncbi:MAG: hypothetical protein HYV95_09370 [Opitutae bacterium]|nr:hypothetical protein [Opitutae bacterium]